MAEHTLTIDAGALANRAGLAGERWTIVGYPTASSDSEAVYAGSVALSGRLDSQGTDEVLLAPSLTDKNGNSISWLVFSLPDLELQWPFTMPDEDAALGARASQFGTPPQPVGPTPGPPGRDGMPGGYSWYEHTDLNLHGQSPETGSGQRFDWFLLDDKVFPGGLAASTPFVTLYEGAVVFDVNRQGTYQIHLITSHKLLGGVQFDTFREINRKIAAAEQVSVPLGVFNSVSSVPLGNYTLPDGSVINITQAMLDADSEIEVRISIQRMDRTSFQATAAEEQPAVTWYQTGFATEALAAGPRGLQGDPGPQGVQGLYDVHLYLSQADDAAAPAKPSAMVDVATGAVSQISAGWSVNVPVQAAGKTVWGSVASVNPSTQTGTVAGVWSNPYEFTGHVTVSGLTAVVHDGTLGGDGTAAHPLSNLLPYPAADKSKLATIAEGAEVNVKSDWNAESGDAEILNKPTIPTVPARAGAFTAADEAKLDGIAAGAEVNVKSDWNANSGDAQILNKPTIPDEADLSSLEDDVDDLKYVTGDLIAGSPSTGWSNVTTVAQGGLVAVDESSRPGNAAAAAALTGWAASKQATFGQSGVARIPLAADPQQYRIRFSNEDGTSTDLVSHWTRLGASGSYVYYVTPGGLATETITLQATGSDAHVGTSKFVGITLPGQIDGVAANATKFLRQDGTWQDPPGGATTPLSDSVPKPPGTAAAGTASAASRGDHVHRPPTWGEVTGKPTIPPATPSDRLLPTLPATGSRDNKIPKFDGDTLGWEVDAGGGAQYIANKADLASHLNAIPQGMAFAVNEGADRVDLAFEYDDFTEATEVADTDLFLIETADGLRKVERQHALPAQQTDTSVGFDLQQIGADQTIQPLSEAWSAWVNTTVTLAQLPAVFALRIKQGTYYVTEIVSKSLIDSAGETLDIELPSNFSLNNNSGVLRARVYFFSGATDAVTFSFYALSDSATLASITKALGLGPVGAGNRLKMIVRKNDDTGYAYADVPQTEALNAGDGIQISNDIVSVKPPPYIAGFWGNAQEGSPDVEVLRLNDLVVEDDRNSVGVELNFPKGITIRGITPPRNGIGMLDGQEEMLSPVTGSNVPGNAPAGVGKWTGASDGTYEWSGNWPSGGMDIVVNITMSDFQVGDYINLTATCNNNSLWGSARTPDRGVRFGGAGDSLPHNHAHVYELRPSGSVPNGTKITLHIEAIRPPDRSTKAPIGLYRAGNFYQRYAPSSPTAPHQVFSLDTMVRNTSIDAIGSDAYLIPVTYSTDNTSDNHLDVDSGDSVFEFTRDLRNCLFELLSNSATVGSEWHFEVWTFTEGVTDWHKVRDYTIPANAASTSQRPAVHIYFDSSGVLDGQQFALVGRGAGARSKADMGDLTLTLNTNPDTRFPDRQVLANGLITTERIVTPESQRASGQRTWQKPTAAVNTWQTVIVSVEDSNGAQHSASFDVRSWRRLDESKQMNANVYSAPALGANQELSRGSDGRLTYDSGSASVMVVDATLYLER